MASIALKESELAGYRPTRPGCRAVAPELPAEENEMGPRSSAAAVSSAISFMVRFYLGRPSKRATVAVGRFERLR